MARHRPLEAWLGIALSRNEEWLGIALSRNGSAPLTAPAGGIKKSKQGLSRVPAELKKATRAFPKDSRA
jgi:hypothetical protein